LNIIKKIEEIVALKADVSLSCRHHAIKESKIMGIIVPCFGSIPWECWLGVFLQSERIRVYMPQDGCSSCKVKNGKQLWEKELHKAEEIARKKVSIISNKELFQSSPATKKHEDNFNQERRLFFSSFFQTVQEVPKNMAKSMAKGSFQNKSVEDENDSMIAPVTTSASQRRRLLINILEKNNDLGDKIFIKIPSISGKCQLCNACSILCPGGALKQTQENESVVLELNSTLCTECNLCADICYNKSIGLVDALAKNLLNPKRVISKPSVET
jgi:Pyruvate/2-oxoacid:ferredoxin oxidoreductase delta subunit